MGRYVAITLHIPHLPLTLNLDLPWRLPIPSFLQAILPAILRQKGYALQKPGPNKGWQLVKFVYQKKVRIFTHTLAGAGIYDGHILTLEAMPLPPWGDPYRFYLEEYLEGQSGHVESLNERIYLAQQKIRFGRHDYKRRYVTDVDLRAFAGGSRVSRRHAIISWRDGRFYIRDRGSRNKTFLNGRALSPHKAYPLEPGDHIAFAKQMLFIFRDTLHLEHE